MDVVARQQSFKVHVYAEGGCKVKVLLTHDCLFLYNDIVRLKNQVPPDNRIIDGDLQGFTLVDPRFLKGLEADNPLVTALGKEPLKPRAPNFNIIGIDIGAGSPEILDGKGRLKNPASCGRISLLAET